MIIIVVISDNNFMNTFNNYDCLFFYLKFKFSNISKISICHYYLLMKIWAFWFKKKVDRLIVNFFDIEKTDKKIVVCTFLFIFS